MAIHDAILYPDFTEAQILLALAHAVEGSNVGRGVDAVQLRSVTTTGAGTVQFRLVQADDAALTSGVRVLKQTDPISVEQLLGGARSLNGIDRGCRDKPGQPGRYFGMQIITSVAALEDIGYGLKIFPTVAPRFGA